MLDDCKYSLHIPPPALPPALLPVPVATNSNSGSSIQLYNGNFGTAGFLKFDQLNGGGVLNWGNDLIVGVANVFVDLGTTIPAALGNGIATGLHRNGHIDELPDFRTKVLTKDWNFENRPRMGVEPYSQERSIELINHSFSFTLDRIFGANIVSNKFYDFLIKLGIKTPIKKGVDTGTNALIDGE